MAFKPQTIRHAFGRNAALSVGKAYPAQTRGDELVARFSIE